MFSVHLDNDKKIWHMCYIFNDTHFKAKFWNVLSLRILNIDVIHISYVYVRRVLIELDLTELVSVPVPILVYHIPKMPEII